MGATVVYPQERGEIQLTLEPSYVRRRGEHLGTVTYDTEIGATDWLQLELAWTAPVIRGDGSITEVGVGDVELGAQLTGVIGAAGCTRPHLIVSYSPQEAHLVPGVSFVLPAGWEIIVGVSLGLSRSADPIGVGFILVYELNPLERRRQ